MNSIQIGSNTESTHDSIRRGKQMPKDTPLIVFQGRLILWDEASLKKMIRDAYRCAYVLAIREQLISKTQESGVVNRKEIYEPHFLQKATLNLDNVSTPPTADISMSAVKNKQLFQTPGNPARIPTIDEELESRFDATLTKQFPVFRVSIIDICIITDTICNVIMAVAAIISP